MTLEDPYIIDFDPCFFLFGYPGLIFSDSLYVFVGGWGELIVVFLITAYHPDKCSHRWDSASVDCPGHS